MIVSFVFGKIKLHSRNFYIFLVYFLFGKRKLLGFFSFFFFLVKGSHIIKVNFFLIPVVFFQASLSDSQKKNRIFF